jgi:hypothetical protein
VTSLIVTKEVAVHLERRKRKESRIEIRSEFWTSNPFLHCMVLGRLFCLSPWFCLFVGFFGFGFGFFFFF